MGWGGGRKGKRVIRITTNFCTQKIRSRVDDSGNTYQETRKFCSFLVCYTCGLLVQPHVDIHS